MIIMAAALLSRLTRLPILNVYGFILAIEFIGSCIGKEIAVYSGKPANLTCPFRQPTYAVSLTIVSTLWSKGKTRGFIGQKLPVDDGEKYIDKDRYVIVDTTLIINNTTYYDDDVYTCTVSYFINSLSDERLHSSGDVKLTICEPFDLTLVLQPPGNGNITGNNTYTVPVASTFAATCAALGGRPETSIRWYINGQPLLMDSVQQRLKNTPDGGKFNSVNSLIFHSVIPEHAGHYSCVACNPALDICDIRTFELSVVVPPGYYDLKSDGRNVQQIEYGIHPSYGIIILSAMLFLLLLLLTVAFLFMRSRKRQAAQITARYTII